MALLSVPASSCPPALVAKLKLHISQSPCSIQARTLPVLSGGLSRFIEHGKAGQKNDIDFEKMDVDLECTLLALLACECVDAECRYRRDYWFT